MSRKEFLFGASYCPYAKSEDIAPEYWERDVANIKKLNFNALRFFIAWDRIERQEGVYDDAKADYMFDLCTKFGIQVILAIGGVFDNHVGKYTPRWLLRDPSIQMQVQDPTLHARQFGPLRLPCPDDPVYAAKARDFTTRIIRRYADRENLAGWSVWNEAFFRNYCYCPLSLQYFRQFLQEKYGSLANLNDAWGTECPLDYQDWNEVEPAVTAGYTGGSFRSGMDFISFNWQKLTGWLDAVDDLVQLNDPLHRPTTTNVFMGAYFYNRSLHHNQFEQNRGRTVPGMSAYNTRIGSNVPADQWLMSCAFSMIRNSGKTRDRGFWILETEAGIFSAAQKNRAAMEQGYRTAAHFQAIMHGAQTILLWKYSGRMSDALSLTCMLTGWDGSITPRAEEAARVAGFLHEYGALFVARQYEADAAVLDLQNSELFGVVDNSLERHVNARFGAYRLLHDLGIQTDVIDECQLKNGAASRYKVLLAPSAPCIDQETVNCLLEYVHNGGTLIADRYFAIYDVNSRRVQRAPGFGLQEVFGAYLNETHFSRDDETFGHDQAISLPLAGEECSDVHLDGALTLAEYASGQPAVAEHRFGQGSAVLCGVACFNRYFQARDDGFARLAQAILLRSGVERPVKIEGDTGHCIHAGRLSGDKLDPVYLIINFSNETTTIRFELDDGGVFHDLRSDFHYSGSSVLCQMEPYQVVVLVRS